jgi:hypothetical protein
MGLVLPRTDFTSDQALPATKTKGLNQKNSIRNPLTKIVKLTTNLPSNEQLKSSYSIRFSLSKIDAYVGSTFVSYPERHLVLILPFH